MYSCGKKFFVSGGVTLWAVGFRHCLYSGITVFSSEADADAFLRDEVSVLKNLIVSPIVFDPGFEFWEGILAEYMEPDGLFSDLNYRRIYKKKGV